MRIKNPLRLCVGCRKFVSANRWAVHGRSSECPGRPLPVPETCEGCGATWPCAACTMIALVRKGLTHEEAAGLMGVTVRRVREELRRDEKRRSRPARDERFAQALVTFVGVLRPHE